jgi:GntR family transcriptional regulator
MTLEDHNFENAFKGIRVNPDEGPVYTQLMTHIRSILANRGVARGRGVPSIRTLAQWVGINPNTVARAYRELELEGVLGKRSSAGTFVAAPGVSPQQDVGSPALFALIDGLIYTAREQGLSLTDVIRLLRQRDQEL